MTEAGKAVGIIGGTGMLGRELARAFVARAGVPPGRLWVSNRSGAPGPLSDLPGLTATADAGALAAACDTVVLCVPPAEAWGLALPPGDRLVISVMAGIRCAALARIGGSARVIRAITGPAAGRGLAHSPWIAGPGATAEDRAEAARLLGACGPAEEVSGEDEIDLFTALTAPAPGLPALFAAAMIGAAAERGVPRERARGAVVAAFRAAAEMMADGADPEAHVAEMIAYAGTTAALMERVRAAGLDDAVGAGLDAAMAKARAMGRPPE